MPKTLTCDLHVEFVPLPEGREAAWMFGMSLVSELLHKAWEESQAELKEQQELTVTEVTH